MVENVNKTDYTGKVNIPSTEELMNVFGSFDENIKIIENEFAVSVSCRDDELRISGEVSAVKAATETLNTLIRLSGKGNIIDARAVMYVISMIKDGNADKIEEIYKDVICITAKGKPVKAKTLGQKRYTDMIGENSVTIGIGPAGTGKTYLAVAAAVAAFKRGDANRIVLTRPAVEAGESLGFLPGDLQNKVDPYLRPLYDALFDMLGADAFKRYMEKNSIEVAPLAYMRGRTLDDSFIILDEAQNTTAEQMKMFLTRIGSGSKAVVTGDLTQTDLPERKLSGLRDAVKVLDGVDGISICELTNKDVVRAELVRRIVKAYERNEEEKSKKNICKNSNADERRRKNKSRGGGN